MSRKFKVWCDSGANIHSCQHYFVTLDDIGIEDDEWDDMDDAEKDEAMRDIAFERLDWGYTEIDPD